MHYIRAIIDSKYEKKTRKAFRYQFLFFLVLYVIPYFLQLLLGKEIGKKAIIVMVVLCQINQFAFIYQEYIQARMMGLDKYF